MRPEGPEGAALGEQIEKDLTEIAKLAASVEAHDRDLRKSFALLGERLAAECRRAHAYARTKDFTIEGDGGDEVYGHLGCSSYFGLHIAHRSVLEDIEDESSGVPGEYQGYSILRPDEWPVFWLRTVATPERIQELLQNLKENLAALAAGRGDVAREVARAADPARASVGGGLTDAAKEFGFAEVSLRWGEAQRAVVVDPPRALTEASVLLETTLKHMLADLKVPLPPDQSILPLYRALAKAANFLPEGHDEGEIRGLLAGLSSVVKNIGAIRTKFGSAHGKSPEQRQGSLEEARLAVDSAGTVATFLMRQLPAIRQRLKERAKGGQATDGR